MLYSNLPDLLFTANWPFIACLIAASGAGAFIVLHRKREGRSLLIPMLFASYLLFFTAVSFAETPGPEGRALSEAERFNLVPGISIVYSLYYNIPYMERQLAINALLYLPFGIFLPASGAWYQDFARTFLVALGIGVATEILQGTLFSNRVSDVNDVICSGFGAATGYAVWKIWSARRWEVRGRHGALGVCAGLLACFVLILIRPFAHFETDYAMADSPYGNPGLIADYTETASTVPQSMPMLKATNGEPLPFSLDRGIMMIDDAQSLIRSGTLVPTEELPVCSAEEAVRRARYGVIISAHYSARAGRTWKMEITSARLVYAANASWDRLLPAWDLTGIGSEFQPVGSHGRHDDTGDEDLKTAELIVPA